MRADRGRRRNAICTGQMFSDHAPLTIGYGFSL